MSRVEPKEEQPPKRGAEQRQRQPVDRTPGKAEGEEKTVDQALGKRKKQK